MTCLRSMETSPDPYTAVGTDLHKLCGFVFLVAVSPVQYQTKADNIQGSGYFNGMRGGFLSTPCSLHPIGSNHMNNI